jgi:ketosteroid isomerase-like protein
MSEENVEAIQKGIDAFDPNDPDWVALWHPDSRSTYAEGWPERGPFVGREAVIRQFRRVTDDWSESRFEDRKVIAESEGWVVVSWRWLTRGAVSGIEGEFYVAAALRVQEGRIIEVHFRWNDDEALEAAGLSE